MQSSSNVSPLEQKGSSNYNNLSHQNNDHDCKTTVKLTQRGLVVVNIPLATYCFDAEKTFNLQR